MDDAIEILIDILYTIPLTEQDEKLIQKAIELIAIQKAKKGGSNG